MSGANSGARAIRRDGAVFVSLLCHRCRAWRAAAVREPLERGRTERYGFAAGVKARSSGG